MSIQGIKYSGFYWKSLVSQFVQDQRLALVVAMQFELVWREMKKMSTKV